MPDAKIKPTQPARVLRILGVVTIVLMLSFVAAMAFMPNNWLRDMANTKGSAVLGRDFSINHIAIDWDWTTPEVTLDKVRIANLPEAKNPNMLVIDQINFRIKIWRLLLGELNLPRLNLKNPKIDLEKLTETQSNWDLPVFSTAKQAAPENRSEFPVIHTLSIDKGALSYRDRPKQLTVTLNLEAAKGENIVQKDSYKLIGEGTLQKKPFSLQATGGSLAELRNSNTPYPLTMNLKMGNTSVKVDGTFSDPLQMAGVDARLDLRGDNLANLYYLTGIPLPPTPPYKISGQLQKQQAVWQFKDFNGKVGDSDLSGNLTYDINKKRDLVKARLISKLLDMDDLAGFIGAAPKKGTRSAEQQAQAKRQEANPRLLPDVPINLTRLRAADMDVRLKATRLKAPGWPLENLDVGFNLEDGILHLAPFDFGVANGTISGSLTLNGQQKTPLVSSDLTLRRLSLKQFFTNPQFKSLSEGRFAGKIKLKGKGISLADVLATSDGNINLIMSGGKISLLIIESAGLDIGQAAPLLLGDDKSTVIRCAIGDFKVTNGLMQSTIFVFDTNDSNIEGKAEINLKEETINAKVEVNPKDFSVFSARTPITVTGRLKDPTVGLDAKPLLTKSAGAVVLGVFLTPLAAIIPFIEPGLGEDSDCKYLIRQARNKTDSARLTDKPAQIKNLKGRDNP